MVSMKDVAVECGVSIATVSKALNDHSDISEETRRKVKEAANRLGYYPNSAASLFQIFFCILSFWNSFYFPLINFSKMSNICCSYKHNVAFLILMQ